MLKLHHGQLRNEPLCPACKRKLDGFTSVGHRKIYPRAGDVSMCCYCRTFLVINQDETFREITYQEIVDLPAEVRSQLVRVRKQLREE